MFDTVLKDTRLVRGDVPFARIVRPGWGVVHARMAMLMPGEEQPPPHRSFLQLFAMVWQNDRWEVAALQNSRLVSLETAGTLESLAAK